MPLITWTRAHAASRQRATTFTKDARTLSVELQTAALLQVEHVALSFKGGVQALEGLDLSVQKGECVSLVGPSGCGKSTLLRLVAGLMAPTAGRVMIDGVDAPEARRKMQDVAFVFQQPTLLPWRTVIKNVQLPLELRGQFDAEGKERVREVLELVGLKDFHKFYPWQLSGGMQMRVSLARALVTRPDLLLLDEPFAALDDITRQRLNEELLSLWERDRFTALFVTHNVSEAVYLSQRVLVMSTRPGRIVEQVSIPFVYPRLPELRAEPDFAQLSGRVSLELRRHSP